MFIDKEELTGYIQDIDAKIKMRHMLDKIEKVIDHHSIESTDFLNPYEARLAKKILSNFIEIDYIEDGGYDLAERICIIIFPEYYYKPDIKTRLTILKVEGKNSGLSDKAHPDYLGASLNLGIVREKIGDILVHKDFAYIIVKEDIHEYIRFGLKQIGNSYVSLSIVESEEILLPIEKYEEKREYLSSLRLDNIISGGYDLSRKDSLELINGGDVKVNWEPIDRPDLEIAIGDIISVKGYGRIKLYDLEGKSRKDKYISIIRKLV